MAFREETAIGSDRFANGHRAAELKKATSGDAHESALKNSAVLKAFLSGPHRGEPCLALQGDAFDLLDSLPDSSVDLFITSPPYWGLRTYGLPHNWNIDKEWKALGNSIHECPPYDWYRENGGVLGLEATPEWYVSHLAEILSKLWRSLKPSGSFWLNIGDTYFARWASIRPEGRQGLGSQERFRRKTPMGGFRQEKNLLLIPSRVAIALQEFRWILRNDLIWFKPNVPPRPDTDRLRLAHEHFFHFVKRPSEGRAKYYYDKASAEPGDADVITCNVRAGENGHTATFPSDLIRPRILSSSPKGGIIVDPFCGSGRALIEAVSSGRRAIGFDQSHEYATLSEQSARKATLEPTYA
jgi:site-specific DNA-methyltransferase (cytosine-N4-specific)